MRPASDDIRTLLEFDEDTGSGIDELKFADNLFVGREPASPDDVVTIFDAQGSPPDKFYDSTLRYHRPSVQVRVRSKGYVEGWQLIDSIKALLHNSTALVNGTRYTAIYCSQEPALLDWDENDRARFVTTFDLQRRDDA